MDARLLPRPPLTARRGVMAGPLPRVVAVAVAAVLLVLAVGWWVRDSPLVSVDHVEVTGASGPQAAVIAGALETAAQDMTTLHVRRDELLAAVASYPVVSDVRVDAHPLHRLSIEVVERQAIGQIALDGRSVAVAGDGTVLDGAPTKGLAVLPLKAVPAGGRLTARHDLVAVRALAAAPDVLRARVTRAFVGTRGLTLRMDEGPSLVLGDSQRLTAKWVAIATVLADATSRGATSIDVRVPQRPAAAGLEQKAGQEAAGVGTPGTATSATPEVTPTTP